MVLEDLKVIIHFLNSISTSKYLHLQRLYLTNKGMLVDLEEASFFHVLHVHNQLVESRANRAVELDEELLRMG